MNRFTGDLSISELVSGTAFCGADAVIITGSATGEPVRNDDLREARTAGELPVIVGSGATAESLPGLLQDADAVIVGSWIKHDGDWRKPVDPARALAFTQARNSHG